MFRGSVRVEYVEQPDQYIAAVLAKVKRHHVERTYEMQGWTDYVQFLEMLARKSRRLFRGGEPDIDGVAKMVLHDFMGGRLPWFSPLPVCEEAVDMSSGMRIDYNHNQSNERFMADEDEGDEQSVFEAFSPPTREQ